jgi:malonate-semialdehyde dehydrogenase (acetylating)/methylmalonate-semialdehyde dehydrogenase
MAQPTNMLYPPYSHDKIVSPQDTPYFTDNEFRHSTSRSFTEVRDPATNNLVTRVPQMTTAELEESISSAKAAFPIWRGMSVIARQQIMFRYVALIKENQERIAAIITLEQGKTLADARGDVLRGLQVAEAACAGPEYMKGEVLEVAKDMETRTYREPLGVVAAICPFSKSIIQHALGTQTHHIGQTSQPWYHCGAFQLQQLQEIRLCSSRRSVFRGRQ